MGINKYALIKKLSSKHGINLNVVRTDRGVYEALRVRGCGNKETPYSVRAFTKMLIDEYGKLSGWKTVKGVGKKSEAFSGFYASWEWKKARYEILKKYNPICMLCGSTEKIVVDHIKPKSKFPELALDLDNLQVLCDCCNKGKSNDDYTDFRPAPKQDKHEKENIEGGYK